VPNERLPAAECGVAVKYANHTILQPQVQVRVQRAPRGIADERNLFHKASPGDGSFLIPGQDLMQL
jgi:hypothetical protein